MCYCTPSIRTPYCHNCYDYMRNLIDDLRERLSNSECEVLTMNKELLELRSTEHRIAVKQIEIDAGIAEEIHDKCCVDVKYTDGYDIAAAIREQK